MSTLDAIQARADAATAGPWEAHLGHGAWMIQDDSCDDIATVHDRMGIDDDPQAEANASFIINARSDLPTLVAALRAVEAVHVMSCELSVSNCDKGESCPLACCGPCGETWPCPTITAIREALN